MRGVVRVVEWGGRREKRKEEKRERRGSGGKEEEARKERGREKRGGHKVEERRGGGRKEEDGQRSEEERAESEGDYRRCMWHEVTCDYDAPLRAEMISLALWFCNTELMLCMRPLMYTPRSWRGLSRARARSKL